MHEHEVVVKGSRYFVFIEDYYDSSGGMFDCELITDDFEEAKKLTVELSNQKYTHEASMFDVKECKRYSYIKGKLDKEQSDLIKFI